MGVRKRTLRLSLVVMFALVFVAAAACGGTKVEKTPIILADTQTGNQVLTNAIAKFLIEVGYDHKVETVSMTPSEMRGALVAGTVHLNLGLVPQESRSWYDDQIGSGNIISLGATFQGDTTIEKVATKGLEEIDPDLVKMLRKFTIRADWLEKTLAWIADSNVQDPQKMAIYYLWNFNFEGGWKTWLPYSSAQPVRDALTDITGLRPGDPYKGQERELTK